MRAHLDPYFLSKAGVFTGHSWCKSQVSVTPGDYINFKTKTYMPMFMCVELQLTRISIHALRSCFYCFCNKMTPFIDQNCHYHFRQITNLDLYLNLAP